MANKLIKNIDDKVWKQFSGYCKAKDVKMGEELTTILKERLKGE